MNKKGYIIIGIILVLIVFAITCSKIISNKEKIDKDYELLEVSNYTYFPLEVSGKYGVIRRDGTVVIPAEYDFVQVPNQDKEIFIVVSEGKYKVLNASKQELYVNFDEVSGIQETANADDSIYNNSVLKYKENDKYGLLDFAGNKITDAKYDEISSLQDKYGEILVKKNNKYGVINIKGTQLVSCRYDYVKGDGFVKDGSYKDGGYIIGNKTKEGYTYGYVDKNEKEILKMDNENVYRVTEINSDDAYIVASKNGRYALYKNKENLTDNKYIDIYYNNGTDTFTVQKNKSFGLIDLSGNVLIPEKYQELMVVGIYVKASLDDVDYTFDLNGNEVENSKYASLEETSTGRFYISIDDNYKYGILDKDKNVVVENEYDYIEEIKSTGLLIATARDNITIYTGSINEVVSVEHAQLERVDNYIKVMTQNEMYYLTSDGKKVGNKTVYLTNNIYANKSGEKWGFVDLKDNVIVPYKYDEVTEVDEYGFAGIKKGGKWGVINSNGDVILEPTYESDELSPIFIGKYCLKNGVARDSI